jgi:hypothetical protein
MFKYAATVPPLYPNRTAITQSTVGPVVWAETIVSKQPVMVAFNALEFWELVKTGLPLLKPELTVELIQLLGGVPAEDVAELHARLAEAEERATANEIGAEVISFAAERAKRRPKASPKTPAAA